MAFCLEKYIMDQQSRRPQAMLQMAKLFCINCGWQGDAKIRSQDSIHHGM
jgi:hypothetical protein